MRLIDILQKEQWDYFINCIYDCCNELGATDNISANYLINELCNIETDAVFVVRCKNCKHFRIWKEGCTTCSFWTDQYDMPTDENAFCSYGELKGDSNE